jgi:signal transduction histidine kinase/ActR/RegA family two-component response regulator
MGVECPKDPTGAGRLTGTRMRDSLKSLIGPRLQDEPAWLRYGLAVALLACVALARAELIPLIGRHSPLLAFVLPVVAAGYLCGRGPAWLIALASPIIGTLFFQHDFTWSDPLGWLAHVAFFVLISAALIELLHHLQVTHRKLLESEARLLEADRRKNEFLAMLAHELRNPLAPLLNIAPVLLTKAYEPSAVRQMSGVLQRQATHLARLVDDLLDVARITRDKIELHPQSLLVQDVIEHALETVRPQIAARRQSVSFESPSHPLKVDGDLVRLSQVVGNLLSNASKFSRDGARIHLSAARVDDVVRIVVRDEGDGIDAQVLPHVFDLFVQGDQSLDRSRGGLGIGLTVAKRLVELHGGSLGVASEGRGRGSEFTITLPVGVLPDPAEATSVVEPVVARRILVVDDNADSAMSLSVLLEMEGHEVRTARDGLAALRELEEFDARVVLLDIGLPGMDGYATADLIRQRRGAMSPYLVALSGYMPTAHEAAGKAVFDSHLTKPLQLAQLSELLACLPASQPRVLSS